MGNRQGGFIHRLKHRRFWKSTPAKIVPPIVSTIENTHLETFLLVWLDPHVESSEENVQTQKRLREILTCLITFDNVKACKDWLERSAPDEKIILIVSGAFGQEIVPQIHETLSIVAIYVYCLDVERNKIWAKDYPKIRAVQSSTSNLLREVSQHKHKLENAEDSRALEIYQSRGQNYSLDTRTASLIWYQLLLEILISPDYLPLPATRQELIRIFREYNFDDQDGSQLIDQFEQTYEPDQAIVWLAHDSLLARLMNKALREQDVNMIFPLRFLLIDIHQQLLEHQARSVNVFKIQLMSKTQMEDIRAHPGQLLVVHGFLFASTDRSQLISTITYSDQYETVLFDIQADYRAGAAPFAFVREINAGLDQQMEREVLFMCAAIFEVGPLQHDGSIWSLQLKLISESDISILSNMKQKLKDNRQLSMIGDLLHQRGQNDKAIRFSQRLNQELAQQTTREVLTRQEMRRKNSKLTLSNVSYFICEAKPMFDLILDPTESVAFILVNLTEHMSEFAAAVLKILITHASKFILVIDDRLVIDFSKWTLQSATIFTTVQCVSTLENIPKHFHIQLLDVLNTNIEQPRFTTIDALISRVADEVIEKCRVFDDEATASSKPESINKKINRIYSELEQIHAKYHPESSTLPTANCAPPMLVHVIFDRDESEEESCLIKTELQDYFASSECFFNEDDCLEYLSAQARTDVFVIIYGPSDNSFNNDLDQFLQVKHTYRYKESRDASNNGMITNRDDLRYRLAYDLLEHYGNLGEKCQADNQSKKAREMFLKARNLCQFLSIFFSCE